ncbi:UDP-glucose 4-epimerase GalE [Polynucleobacter paneuropaeus]|jgi:UDP-glucose 4-epimerase|uniref:UDP-glucose 4-epimerase GalE n=1 Tax=Polynucleobacter paneuropaeus TaxID=2527775 RepID=UPI001BFD7CA3|nr:UDP-glucose 4-epimerase GalE [Polynucleobacter paneuropaeus]MBT8633189.1 UDP-glucose 4-epimerase GalE [Polynucleobacter paneuropaeus]
MNILLTGGAGYIGSHAAVVLCAAGHNVVILDNFCNSQHSVLDRLTKIVGKPMPCIEGDIRDTLLLEKVLKDYKIETVMHFAGLKAVGESVQNPLDYFDNNVGGTISLLHAMRSNNVKSMVFSSSATVYGMPNYLPLDEAHPTQAKNPYGRSKLHIEEILTDLAASDPAWHISFLRYFNPVGAHESGLIGEDPNGIPNNLVPYIAQVALGRLPHLNVYGDDYPTADGSGVRDYIHVMDLAEGHLAALNYIQQQPGVCVFNLGSGKGSSVFEVVKVFENENASSIPLKVTMRRIGDVSECYAKVDKANIHLNWKATRTLQDMCRSTWNFQKNHKCANQ